MPGLSLALTTRFGLGGIHNRIIFFLFQGVGHVHEHVWKVDDIVPGPVGEIDDGPAGVVDCHDPADLALEASEIRPGPGPDGDDPVRPGPLEVVHGGLAGETHVFVLLPSPLGGEGLGVRGESIGNSDPILRARPILHFFQLYFLLQSGPLLTPEGRGELSLCRGQEVQPLHELAGLLGPVLAVHAGVVPVYGQRPVVADFVQGPDDAFPVHSAPARAAELPAAAGIARGPVAREDAAAAVEGEYGILHVDVIDAVREATQERDGVHALPVQVARVEGESEFFAVVEGVEHGLGAEQVEGDLARVDFEGELDAAVSGRVEDRVPIVGETFEAVFDHAGLGTRVAGHVRPDGGTRKARDDADAEFLGEAERRGHLLRGPAVHFERVAVAPDVVGHEGPVAFVHDVADRVADFVIGDDGDGEIVTGQQFEFIRAVTVFAQAALDFEVIAPAA